MPLLPEAEIIARLYHDLLEAWNRRSARDFAALFVAYGSVVGFDGTPMNGAMEIEASLEQIFSDQATAAYVGKIRFMRSLGPSVALVQAVCGMIPPGLTDINPAVNAIQGLVLVEQPEGWRIVYFQNTPAQFHGRPEISAALTEELRELVKG